MKLYTDYNEFSSEYPEIEYLHYKVTETGQTPYYIGAYRFEPIDRPFLTNFFDNFPDFSVQSTEQFSPWEILTITSFKNLSKEVRQITVECLNEGSLDLFKYSVLDNGIEPFTINTEENKVTFCLKPQEPISCESSTVPVALIEEFPDLSNMKVKINGIEYDGSDLYHTGQDFSEGLPPILISYDYGTSIANTGTSCVLIEFPFDKEEHYISSLPFGVEGEWSEDGSSFLLSLAGQIFTPAIIDVMVLDENDWSVSNLKPQQSYRLQIRIHGENPDPSWKATVSVKGETYLLDLNNTTLEIEFVTPPNNTNVGFYFDFEYELHTDFEYRYSNGDSIPTFVVMPQDLFENQTATINTGNSYETEDHKRYSFEVMYFLDSTTLRYTYNLSCDNYINKYDYAYIRLNPNFAGYKLGVPFENVVLDSTGSASIDLKLLPKYQSSWYKGWYGVAFIQIHDPSGEFVVSANFKTNLEYISVNRIYKYSGNYSDINGVWEHVVGKPYEEIKLGYFDSKVKKVEVSLITNPMNAGANFLPVPLQLDVVDGYAKFTPPTPTAAYDSSLNMAYYVTRIMFKILEADDPALVGRISQSVDIKVVISNA